jgi:thymidylate synthase (FAD)
MRIVQPSATVISWTVDDPERLIEWAGRVCYKSQEKITADSHVAFIKMILKSGHESVLEHASASFHLVTDRGISHELVRHRLASYSQESTRYCNYGNQNSITVIQPCGIISENAKHIWYDAMERAERYYLALLDEGLVPQVARSVLPTCLKTEVVMTANFREWRHFLKLRLSPAAHPDMRELAGLIRDQLVTLAPTVFEEFKP